MSVVLQVCLQFPQPSSLWVRVWFQPSPSFCSICLKLFTYLSGRITCLSSCRVVLTLCPLTITIWLYSPPLMGWIPGRFPTRHFPTRHFPTRHLPTSDIFLPRHFPTKTFPYSDISLLQMFPYQDVSLLQTFPYQDIPLPRHFPT